MHRIFQKYGNHKLCGKDHQPFAERFLAQARCPLRARRPVVRGTVPIVIK
jgi:hypothetical protein